jgi:hypothetical protein
MSWYKQSLRFNTEDEREGETFETDNIGDIEFLVSLLVERKRLINVMGEDKNGPEVNKLKDIWESYPPRVQFLAVNKHNSQEF